MPPALRESRLISGDWGTTTLRLRLIRTAPFAVEAEVELPWGMAAVHEAWQATAEDRQPFYLARLVKALSFFEPSIEKLPIYLSGMASSSVGMVELPYACVPFALDAALPALTVPATDECPHPVTILSGIRWEHRDVMRGEETQIVGLACHEALTLPEAFQVILPGTHSKHVSVQAATIVGFQTFLTGDLYEAVAGHTILKHSLTAERAVRDRVAFGEGVRAAASEGLLPNLFRIRCADLFGERSPTGNDAYFSGLLLGSELHGVAGGTDCLLVAEDTLGDLYAEALGLLGHGGRLLRIPSAVMREAVPRAHAVIHRNRDLPTAYPHH